MALLALALASCQPARDGEGVTVIVEPSSVTLAPEASTAFEATVIGSSDLGVTWTVTGGAFVVHASGVEITYTAPAVEGEFEVTATSTADPSESATAVVTVVPASSVSLSLSPAAVTLAPGTTQPFTATVVGTSDTSVTWAATCGSVAGTGSTVTYTAPASEGTCTVTATSVADPSADASATVTIEVVPAATVAITPSAATLAPGGTHAFTATVSGLADTSVTWAATCGSIAGAGSTVTYTAPGSEGTCTVTATSVADPSESASATVTVATTEQVTVSVTPSSAILRIGRSETFTSSVTGTSNTAVTWSATGGTFVGETAVVYTAPDTLGAYTLTATSVADPSKSASATIDVVAHPQELWAIQYGTSDHDGAAGVAVDGDGAVYVVGASEGDLFGPPEGSLDGYLLKLDADGSQVWTRTLGAKGAITGLDGVAVGPAGNVVVAGGTTGGLGGAGSHVGGMDVVVAKYAPNGARLWIRQIGCSQGDNAHAVAVDPLGNVFVVGSTLGDLGGPGTHKGSYDAFLIKLDENGNHLWTRQAGTSVEDWGQGVAAGAAGNVVMTGYSFKDLFGPHLGEMDAFVLKMSAAGDFMWARQFGTGAWDTANGAAIDLAGNVIAAGTTRGSLPGPGLHQGGEDAWVAKLGPDGTPLWARQYGTTEDDRLHAVAVGWAGNVVAVGDTVGALAEPNPDHAWDGLVAKVDPNGVLTWTRQFGTGVWGGLETTIAWDVAIGPSGNVVVVGHTGGSLAGPHQGWNDAFVIKMAP
jgi:hypothetical protein